MKEEEIKKLFSTKAFQSVANHFAHLQGDYDFIKKLRYFRKKFSLPVDGMEEKLYSGKHITLPKLVDDAREEIGKWVKELGFESLWVDEFQYLIAYGEPLYSKYVLYSGLVSVSDVHEDLFGPYQSKPEEEFEYEGETVKPYELEREFREDIARYEFETKPIAILISPYASKTDIIDYVRKTYSTDIKPLQESYRDPKVKIDKTRNRDAKRIDRDLAIKFLLFDKFYSANKVAEEIQTKFPRNLWVTEEYIRKIKERHRDNNP
jgi:hypothetical protein